MIFSIVVCCAFPSALVNLAWHPFAKWWEIIFSHFVLNKKNEDFWMANSIKYWGVWPFLTSANCNTLILMRLYLHSHKIGLSEVYFSLYHSLSSRPMGDNSGKSLSPHCT
jgi:hypothetical protein